MSRFKHGGGCVKIFFLFFFLFFGIGSCFGDTGNNETTQQPNLQQKYKNEISRCSNNISILKSDLKLESERFSDVGKDTQLFMYLVTAIVTIASFVGYASVTKGAKEQSEKYVNKWISEKEKLFNSRMSELEEKLKESSTKFEEYINNRTSYLNDIINNSINGLQGENKQQSSIAQDSFIITGTYSEVDDGGSVIELSPKEESRSTSELAASMFSKGLALRKMDKKFEAIEAYSNLIDKFGSSDDRDILFQVAKTMFNKGLALWNMDKKFEAIEEYDNLIDKFVSSDDPATLFQVAKTMFNKGFSLRKMDKNFEAIEEYDNLIDKFGSSDDPAILLQVANSMFNKGLALFAMDKKSEAIQIFINIIKKFGSAQENMMQNVVNRSISIVSKNA